MTEPTSVKSSPSSLVERLESAIDRWAPTLPKGLQEAFRREFRDFGAEHDRTMSTIENIWKRREKRYAFDESTGLARRKPFHDHLAAVLTTPESPVLTAVGLLFIDVDNLKKVNDSFGHAAGDRALSAVGAIIREAIRVDLNMDFMTRTDASEGDYSVSRHGGDEFLVALELKDPAGIDVVAMRIKAHVDDLERQRAHGYTSAVPLSVSVGGVVYALASQCPPLPAHALATALIKVADAQMYESKRSGLIHIVSAHCTETLEVDLANKRTLGSPGA
jgi:diguanylate cyclase (GGDEF)-like protein